MGNDSLWVVLGYPLLFSTPWIAGIVWLCKRTHGGDGTPEPSMGERARSRLDIR